MNSENRYSKPSHLADIVNAVISERKQEKQKNDRLVAITKSIQRSLASRHSAEASSANINRSVSSSTIINSSGSTLNQSRTAKYFSELPVASALLDWDCSNKYQNALKDSKGRKNISVLVSYQSPPSKSDGDHISSLNTTPSQIENLDKSAEMILEQRIQALKKFQDAEIACHLSALELLGNSLTKAFETQSQFLPMKSLGSEDMSTKSSSRSSEPYTFNHYHRYSPEDNNRSIKPDSPIIEGLTRQQTFKPPERSAKELNKRDLSDAIHFLNEKVDPVSDFNISNKMNRKSEDIPITPTSQDFDESNLSSSFDMSPPPPPPYSSLHIDNRPTNNNNLVQSSILLHNDQRNQSIEIEIEKSPYTKQNLDSFDGHSKPSTNVDNRPVKPMVMHRNPSELSANLGASKPQTSARDFEHVKTNTPKDLRESDHQSNNLSKINDLLDKNSNNQTSQINISTKKQRNFAATVPADRTIYSFDGNEHARGKALTDQQRQQQQTFLELHNAFKRKSVSEQSVRANGDESAPDSDSYTPITPSSVRQFKVPIEDYDTVGLQVDDNFGFQDTAVPSTIDNDLEVVNESYDQTYLNEINDNLIDNDRVINDDYIEGLKSKEGEQSIEDDRFVKSIQNDNEYYRSSNQDDLTINDLGSEQPNILENPFHKPRSLGAEQSNPIKPSATIKFPQKRVSAVSLLFERISDDDHDEAVSTIPAQSYNDPKYDQHLDRDRVGMQSKLSNTFNSQISHRSPEVQTLRASPKPINVNQSKEAVRGIRLANTDGLSSDDIDANANAQLSAKIATRRFGDEKPIKVHLHKNQNIESAATSGRFENRNSAEQALRSNQTALNDRLMQDSSNFKGYRSKEDIRSHDHNLPMNKSRYVSTESPLILLNRSNQTEDLDDTDRPEQINVRSNILNESKRLNSLNNFSSSQSQFDDDSNSVYTANDNVEFLRHQFENRSRSLLSRTFSTNKPVDPSLLPSKMQQQRGYFNMFRSKEDQKVGDNSKILLSANDDEIEVNYDEGNYTDYDDANDPRHENDEFDENHSDNEDNQSASIVSRSMWISSLGRTFKGSWKRSKESLKSYIKQQKMKQLRKERRAITEKAEKFINKYETKKKRFFDDQIRAIEQKKQKEIELELLRSQQRGRRSSRALRLKSPTNEDVNQVDAEDFDDDHYEVLDIDENEPNDVFPNKQDTLNRKIFVQTNYTTNQDFLDEQEGDLGYQETSDYDNDVDRTEDVDVRHDESTLEYVNDASAFNPHDELQYSNIYSHEDDEIRYESKRSEMRSDIDVQNKKSKLSKNRRRRLDNIEDIDNQSEVGSVHTHVSKVTISKDQIITDDEEYESIDSSELEYDDDFYFSHIGGTQIRSDQNYSKQLPQRTTSRADLKGNKRWFSNADIKRKIGNVRQQLKHNFTSFRLPLINSRNEANPVAHQKNDGSASNNRHVNQRSNPTKPSTIPNKPMSPLKKHRIEAISLDLHSPSFNRYRREVNNTVSSSSRRHGNKEYYSCEEASNQLSTSLQSSPKANRRSENDQFEPNISNYNQKKNAPTSLYPRPIAKIGSNRYFNWISGNQSNGNLQKITRLELDENDKAIEVVYYIENGPNDYTMTRVGSPGHLNHKFPITKKTNDNENRNESSRQTRTGGDGIGANLRPVQSSQSRGIISHSSPKVNRVDSIVDDLNPDRSPTTILTNSPSSSIKQSLNKIPISLYDEDARHAAISQSFRQPIRDKKLWNSFVSSLRSRMIPSQAHGANNLLSVAFYPMISRGQLIGPLLNIASLSSTVDQSYAEPIGSNLRPLSLSSTSVSSDVVGAAIDNDEHRSESSEEPAKIEYKQTTHEYFPANNIVLADNEAYL